MIYTDYKTIDSTNPNKSAIVAYTVEYRCMVMIELLSSNANDNNKGVFVVADNLGYQDDPTIPALFVSGGISSTAQDGMSPYIFTKPGARILFSRGDIYGSATIRIHIFKMPVI